MQTQMEGKNEGVTEINSARAMIEDPPTRNNQINNDEIRGGSAFQKKELETNRIYGRPSVTNNNNNTLMILKQHIQLNTLREEVSQISAQKSELEAEVSLKNKEIYEVNLF